MNIYDILIDSNARITLDERCIICDLINTKGDSFVFKVYERKKYTKEPKILYEGHDENKACKILLDEE